MKLTSVITEILVLALFLFLTARSMFEVIVHEDMSALTPMLCFGGISLGIILFIVDNKINPHTN